MKQSVHTFKKLHYVLVVPDDFDQGKKYPVLLFLHGAGSRGNDIQNIISNPYFTMTSKHNLPIITYAPQCYADTWFDIFEQLQEFADFVRDEPNCDKNRFYVMGASMGGFATWQLAATMAGKFAAVIPICGGGMEWNAARLATTPIWAFHGCDDNIVDPGHTIDMVEHINQNGGNAKMTLYENVKHGSWENVYQNKEVFEWMLKQTLSQNHSDDLQFNDPKNFG